MGWFWEKKYAIYNDENFHINDNAGLDLDVIKKGSYFIGETDERFIGNTAIAIDDEYIAIWNEDFISKDTNDKKRHH